MANLDKADPEKVNEVIDSIYWSPQTLLSYNRIFNFVIGARGVGKTYGMKKFCIDRFIKRKAQFVWVRRYKTEMNFQTTFFADIAGRYPDHEFNVKGGCAYMDGQIMGYFIALSVSAQKKSSSYPNVETVVFDEFIIEKGSLHYLRNEAESFLELFETVARTRDNVRAVFLANAISISNPYFIYFDLFPRKNLDFTVSDSIVIENVSNLAFANFKTQTRFGQLVKGTAYYNYAVENEYLRDSDEFVLHEKPKGLKYACGVTYRGQSFGVWLWKDKGLVVNTKYNPSAESFAISKDDGSINQQLIFANPISPVLRSLKEMFKRSLTFYENQMVKNAYFEIMSFLGVR